MNRPGYGIGASIRMAVSATMLLACVAAADAGETAAGNSVTYSLPANSAKLYPDASWLPGTYKPYYPDLAKTIEAYTRQSLDRSGLKKTRVAVRIDSMQQPHVTLTGPDRKAMRAFARVHIEFLDAMHAVQGLAGVLKCQTTPGCWDPHPDAQYPWALFLPFGMAMTGQPVVNFMNYPPAVSLEQKDYLNNNTMKRWSGVLEAVGIANPARYETIVDGRPIAAAGTGQADYLPDINTYFNSAGNRYVTPMLSLLAASNNRRYSKAVVVLGAPAGKDWAAVIGASGVQPGDVGTTDADVIAPGKQTNWVAGNHPNVTSYQCCPGDPSPKCQPSQEYPSSTDLVADEQTDLMVACIEKGLGKNPAADVNELKAACRKAWNPSDGKPLPPKNQNILCMRARLDYSWNGIGNCATQKEALTFCARHDNNACAAGPTGIPYKCGE